MAVYRQTFQRHRLLLSVPILIATVIAAWFSFGAAPSYRSTASLWVDNGSAIASSMGNTAAASTGVAGGPAALESQVISELLLTPTFDMAVARDSMLPAFLASGASAGGFSPSVLLSGHRAPMPRSMADGAAASEIATQVTATSTGPQVLKLSYTGASPAVARSVLQAVIRQIGAGAMFGDSIGKTASSFFRSRLESAGSLVSGNDRALTNYTRAHPHANAANDATVRALMHEVALADAQLASIQAASQQANTEAQVNGGAATLKVIDAPDRPSGPVKGFSSQVMGIIAGAFAGLVMSLLSLYALTPRPPLRWDAEMPVFARMTALDLTGRYARARRRAAARAATSELSPRPEGP